MVVSSLKVCSCLADNVELKLDEADRAAEMDMIRLSHEEVFGKIKDKLLREETM